MNLSRVTWLVLGTTMVLVSAVIVAAVLFVDGGSEPFPSAGAGGASGVAQVKSIRAGEGNPGGPSATTSAGTRQVAAHFAATGVTTALASLAPGRPARSRITSPTGHQYADSLQQLEAKLGE